MPFQSTIHLYGYFISRDILETLSTINSYLGGWIAHTPTEEIECFVQHAKEKILETLPLFQFKDQYGNVE